MKLIFDQPKCEKSMNLSSHFTQRDTTLVTINNALTDYSCFVTNYYKISALVARILIDNSVIAFLLILYHYWISFFMEESPVSQRLVIDILHYWAVLIS